jgi:hypothetical protein
VPSGHCMNPMRKNLHPSPLPISASFISIQREISGASLKILSAFECVTAVPFQKRQFVTTPELLSDQELHKQMPTMNKTEVRWILLFLETNLFISKQYVMFKSIPLAAYFLSCGI